jgi:CheY-like chemotaxis protein
MMGKRTGLYRSGGAGKAACAVGCPGIRRAIVGGVPPRDAAPVHLWLVDDTLEHHATARATLAGFPQVEFTGFEDAGEAIDEYRRLAQREEPELPRIVLMDFYLGEWRGDAVTRELRQLQPAAAPLIIVGYSSVAQGSERILAAGGNLVVRKIRDRAGKNPLLARWLEESLTG